jgi:hypothetical protein
MMLGEPSIFPTYRGCEARRDGKSRRLDEKSSGCFVLCTFGKPIGVITDLIIGCPNTRISMHHMLHSDEEKASTSL